MQRLQSVSEYDHTSPSPPSLSLSLSPSLPLSLSLSLSLSLPLSLYLQTKVHSQRGIVRGAAVVLQRLRGGGGGYVFGPPREAPHTGQQRLRPTHAQTHTHMARAPPPPQCGGRGSTRVAAPARRAKPSRRTAARALRGTRPSAACAEGAPSQGRVLIPVSRAGSSFWYSSFLPPILRLPVSLAAPPPPPPPPPTPH